MRHATFALVITLSIAFIGAEEQKLLTLDDLDRVNFSGNALTGLTWLDAEHYVERRGQLMKINALSGAAVPLYNVAKMEAAFAKFPEFESKTAKGIADHPERMNSDRTSSLILRANRLYHYKFGQDSAAKLNADALPGIENISQSPDGTHVAFVRNFKMNLLSNNSLLSITCLLIKPLN